MNIFRFFPMRSLYRETHKSAFSFFVRKFLEFALLRTGENPAYDLLTSIDEGDSTYIYIRSIIPLEIAWNTETQTYELS